MTNNIKDIFFDLDHTLWDFDANSSLAFAKVLKDYNIPVGLDEFLEVYMPINKKYWDDYSYSKIDAATLKTGRLRETLSCFSIPFHEKELVVLSDSYLVELTNNNLLFEDALPTLDYLQGKYKMHIITNGFSQEQHIKIQRSGLASYFKTITTSDEAGVKKPDPKIFQQALQRANAKPNTALMIGDNFDADILGANKVGMHVIHYDYHKEQIPKKFTQISELKELKSLI